MKQTKQKCEICKQIKAAKHQKDACYKALQNARTEFDRDHWSNTVNFWNGKIEELEAIDPETIAKKQKERERDEELDFRAREIQRMLGDHISYGGNSGAWYYEFSTTGYVGRLSAGSVDSIYWYLVEYFEGKPMSDPFMGTSKATYEHMIAYHFERDAVFQMGTVRINLPNMLPVLA